MIMIHIIFIDASKVSGLMPFEQPVDVVVQGIDRFSDQQFSKWKERFFDEISHIRGESFNGGFMSEE
jgi:hypothetical protein